jgi:Ca2+-binding RTX toxin-like protein
MASLFDSNDLWTDLSESNNQRQPVYSSLLNIVNSKPLTALSTQTFSAQLVLSTSSVNANSVFKPAELANLQPMSIGELNPVSTTVKPSPSSAALTSYIPLTGDVNQASTTPLQGKSVSSGDQRIDTLLSGYKWGVKTLTYSFFAGGTYYSSEKALLVSEGAKANIRYILENVIEPVINVNFVEVKDSSATKSYGQLRYLDVLLPKTDSTLGYAQMPFSTDQNQGNSNDTAGDVRLNKRFDIRDEDTGFQNGIGSDGYETLLHETLHALGLKHPGDYNGDSGGEPPYLPLGQDNYDNSVMSYNFTPTSPGTLMDHDVLALQYLYGTRPLNPGNTTYTFNSVFGYSDGSRTVGSATSKTKLTLWDSGGNDTLNFSKLGPSAGYYLDLSAGGWLTKTAALNSETYDAKQTGRKTGKIFTANGPGTKIGSGVTIENAIGSTSNDTLVGNGSNNTLISNGGNDFISGGSGSDTLIGGAGDSTLAGGLGNNFYYTQSLGDVIIAGGFPGETNTVRSYINFRMNDESEVNHLGLLTTNNLNGIGNNLDNTIVGNSGKNKLDGQDGNDTLMGGGGADTLIGGLGNDLFVVDNAAVIVVEKYKEGIDTVHAFVDYTLGNDVERLGLQGTSNLKGTGNALSNTIVGNRGNNLLSGQAGRDSLYGGVGNDMLIGGTGDDILTGNAGNDSFLYATGAAFTLGAIGIDRLTDFGRTAGNTDKITLSSNTFNAGKSFANVATDALAATSGAFITFSTGTGNLFYNQNGVDAGFGSGGQFATVNNVSSLLATDFAIVA